MTKEQQVMTSFDVYAEQATKLHAMILNSGDKRLETEFDALIQSVNLMTKDLISKYRKDLGVEE